MVRLAFQIVEQIVAVDIVAIAAPVQLDAVQELLLDVRCAGDRREGRQPVLVRDDPVERLAFRKMPGPKWPAG